MEANVDEEPVYSGKGYRLCRSGLHRSSVAAERGYKGRGNPPLRWWLLESRAEANAG